MIDKSRTWDEFFNRNEFGALSNNNDGNGCTSLNYSFGHRMNTRDRHFNLRCSIVPYGIKDLEEGYESTMNGPLSPEELAKALGEDKEVAV